MMDLFGIVAKHARHDSHSLERVGRLYMAAVHGSSDSMAHLQDIISMTSPGLSRIIPRADQTLDFHQDLD